LMLGAALVVLALLAFVRQWRAVLVSVVAVPLSLMAALLVLRLTGQTINALVVAGLVVALGAVIGDAVGDAQIVGRRARDRRAARADASTASGVLEATLHMRGAMGSATLILLLAIVPAFFAGGTDGAFIHPLALAYGLSVLASMVVALTVAPALSAIVYARPPRRTGEAGLAAAPARAWGGVVAGIIPSPRLGL